MISLILPAYNPGEKIVSTWFAVRNFLNAQPEPWEALFVLDGCTDDSSERLERLAAETGDARMKVLGYSENKGKGHAVRTGLLAATGRVRVFTDVDLAYDFEDIQRIASEVSSDQPVAIASRAHPDSLLMIPDRMLWYAFRRKLQSVAFRTATRMLLGLKQRDTQAGLKAFTAEVVEHLVPHLDCNGFGFDCELLYACNKAHIPVADFPVRVRYEEGTTTSTMTGFKMLRELRTIRKAWKKKTISTFAANAPAGAKAAA